MKKYIIVLMIAIALLSAQAYAVNIEVKGAYYFPSDKSFKDIYGNGLMIGAEIVFKISGPLDMWIEGNYLTAKGKLSYTQEVTTVKIIPAGAGIRYTYLAGRVSPYVGAGARYYQYKESNPIGIAKKGGFGFVVTGGVGLKIVDRVSLDFRLGYSSCSMTPADFKINIGGLEAGGGLVIAF
jgi:opacity protein-like surface antigen